MLITYFVFPIANHMCFVVKTFGVDNSLDTSYEFVFKFEFSVQGCWYLFELCAC